MHGLTADNTSSHRATHNRLPAAPQSGVPVAYRPPFNFGGECYRDTRQHGESILEIVRSVPDLPKMFMTHGIVCINGEIVPRNLWPLVRPKPTSEHVPINVTLHFPLQGGKGSSSKSIIGIIAAVALLAVTAFIAGPAGVAALGSIGIEGSFLGITAAQFVAGAVGLAGALAISALTAPPAVNDSSIASSSENTDNKESAGASANIIDPGGAIPRIVGTRKVYPPLVSEPIVQMIANDEFVEAVYGLNGPHNISDIRVDGASIDSVDDVEFETREGWDTDTALTLVTRYGRSATPNLQLTQHALRTDGFTLMDQATPTNSLPIFHRIVSKRSPDEMWLQFVLPSGLFDINALSTARLIPIRIRMRTAGTVPGAWINLPELHLTSLEQKQLRKTIYFHWNTQSSIATPPNPATGNYGWTGAYNEVPGQNVTPNDPGTQWEANDYFDNGTGTSQGLTSSTVATTRIINVDLGEHDVDIYLNDSVFPRSVIWEFEIMRGHTVVRSGFNYSTYTFSGTVKNFFEYVTVGGNQQLFVTQQGVNSTLVVVRLVSVWYAQPVQTTGFALVAIRARNRTLNRVSCVAKGYVQDWDGANWATWTTTSNAAPHYRDVLRGAQNQDPLDATLVDDTGLVNWRSLCAVNDWRCDLIIDDMRTQDVLSAIASTSYARPYQSDIYGVTVDNNRANDVPVQVFSRVNSRNMHWDKAFPRIPQGFIVTYRDEATDNDRAQTIVDQADPELATTGLYESVSYDGIVNVDKVRTRARFDLDQANMRSIFYSLETDLESLMCRRGSLVGLQSEIITSFSGEGRVVTKNRSGGNVLSLTLDSKATIPSSVPNAIAGISSSAISDRGISDFASVTVVPMGIAIRRSDGTVTVHRITNSPGETDTLVFETPIPDDASVLAFQDSDINYRYGSMVTWGPIGVEYRRLLVQAINPGKDLTATLTLVDEAPYLNRNTPP